MVDGSTCGRAGRRFRRMSFVFFAGGSPSAVEVRVVLLAIVVRAAPEGSVAGCCSVSGDAERLRDGEVEAGARVTRACTTSAMLAVVLAGQKLCQRRRKILYSTMAKHDECYLSLKCAVMKSRNFLAPCSVFDSPENAPCAVLRIT